MMKNLCLGLASAVGAVAGSVAIMLTVPTSIEAHRSNSATDERLELQQPRVPSETRPTVVSNSNTNGLSIASFLESEPDSLLDSLGNHRSRFESTPCNEFAGLSLQQANLGTRAFTLARWTTPDQANQYITTQRFLVQDSRITAAPIPGVEANWQVKEYVFEGEDKEFLNQCFRGKHVVSFEILENPSKTYEHLRKARRSSDQDSFIGREMQILFDGQVLVLGTLIYQPEERLRNTTDPVPTEAIAWLEKNMLAVYDRAVVLGVTAHDASLASEQARQDVRARLQAEGINAEP